MTAKHRHENLMCCLHRYCFPFGRPEGALKATLSLLERVSIFYSCGDVSKDFFKTLSSPHDVPQLSKNSWVLRSNLISICVCACVCGSLTF